MGRLGVEFWKSLGVGVRLEDREKHLGECEVIQCLPD